MNYKLFIDTFAESLISIGAADKESIKGVTLNKIIKLEKTLNIKLPEIYRQFLLKCGNGAGDYCRGEYFRFYCLEELQEGLNELLEEEQSDIFPLKNKFVFFHHDADDYLFFPTDQGDNPPVYGYRPQINYIGEIERSKKFLEEVRGIESTKKFNKFFYIENGGKHFDSFSDYLINGIDLLLSRNRDMTYREIIDRFKLSY